MIEAVIRWSVSNRFFVLLATIIIVGGGLVTMKNTPVDAIPDLSDVHKFFPNLEALSLEGEVNKSGL